MLINKGIIRRNIVITSILIYICLYIILMYLKPSFLFNKTGSLRDFGIGFFSPTIGIAKKTSAKTVSRGY